MTNDVSDAILSHVSDFAVGLVLRDEGAGSKVLGSGVLVSIDGRRGILTCGHVAAAYEKLPEILSPQPNFSREINGIARHWRAFSFIANCSKRLQKKYVYSQWVRANPSPMRKPPQKFHGTKLAQSGTKSRPKTECVRVGGPPAYLAATAIRRVASEANSSNVITRRIRASRSRSSATSRARRAAYAAPRSPLNSRCPNVSIRLTAKDTSSFVTRTLRPATAAGSLAFSMYSASMTPIL